MQWHTADVSMVGRPLFTSDRPVIYSNGLAYANSHLVLPVSPTRLFVATNSDATARSLLNDMPRRELVKPVSYTHLPSTECIITTMTMQMPLA